MQVGDYVILTVSDTGRGIAAADLGKIFEPFYTKKVMGRSGTGLGLAVVWGTVKDHNGYIDVRSEEGKGSTFTLYFPVTREALSKAQEAVSPEMYRGKGESILVVDDVKEQRELATSMLTGLGYQVTSVSGGKEAVEYVRNNKVDLIVLDMIMDPGIDGLETYRKDSGDPSPTEGCHCQRIFRNGPGSQCPGPRCRRVCPETLCAGKDRRGHSTGIGQVSVCAKESILVTLSNPSYAEPIAVHAFSSKISTLCRLLSHGMPFIIDTILLHINFP